MTPGNQRHLPTLRFAEAALQNNVQVAGIDETARSHMELALAHVRESTDIVRAGVGRTVREVVSDHHSFESRLQVTLHISNEQFPENRSQSTEAATCPAMLADMALRQQFDNLEKSNDALRLVLHSHDIEEDSRAHLERAKSHTAEAYVASSQPGMARSVSKLVSDLEKVERLFAKLRERHLAGQVAQTLRA